VQAQSIDPRPYSAAVITRIVQQPLGRIATLGPSPPRQLTWPEGRAYRCDRTSHPAAGALFWRQRGGM